jgi:hypothetical protein
MADSVNNVKSGSLTYAVRDTKIDGVEIKKDAFMLNQPFALYFLQVLRPHHIGIVRLYLEE